MRMVDVKGGDFPDTGANQVGDIKHRQRRITLTVRWKECPLFANCWVWIAGPRQNGEVSKVPWVGIISSLPPNALGSHTVPYREKIPTHPSDALSFEFHIFKIGITI